jgi:hypothetical protein
MLEASQEVASITRAGPSVDGSSSISHGALHRQT